MWYSFTVSHVSRLLRKSQMADKLTIAFFINWTIQSCMGVILEDWFTSFCCYIMSHTYRWWKTNTGWRAYICFNMILSLMRVLQPFNQIQLYDNCFVVKRNIFYPKHGTTTRTFHQWRDLNILVDLGTQLPLAFNRMQIKEGRQR